MIELIWSDRLKFISAVLKGVPYVIAGGFPRDIHFGVEPKDIDVWIQFDGLMYSDISRIGRIENFLINIGMPHKVINIKIQSDKYGDISPNDMVFLIQVAGIDFIVVDKPVFNIIESFDYNLNQFMWINDKPEFMGSTLEKLIPLKDVKDIPEERAYKMQNKFNELVLGIKPVENYTPPPWVFQK